jgi:hypothetical protein
MKKFILLFFVVGIGYLFLQNNGYLGATPKFLIAVKQNNRSTCIYDNVALCVGDWINKKFSVPK